MNLNEAQNDWFYTDSRVGVHKFPDILKILTKMG